MKTHRDIVQEKKGVPEKTGIGEERWAEMIERGRKGERGKCCCGNGVCHRVVAAGCCCGSGRQMDRSRRYPFSFK